MQDQVDRLKKIRRDKACPSAQMNLKQAGDFEVYKRADEGVLNSARVIERANKGELVNGSGATCTELSKIIKVNNEAVEIENAKLEKLGAKANPKDVEALLNAEKAIEKQVKKLKGLQKVKECK